MINTSRPSRMPLNLLGVILGLVDDIYLVGGTEKYLIDRGHK